MNKIISSTSKIIAPAVAAAILTATPKVQAGVGDFIVGMEIRSKKYKIQIKRRD